MDPKGDSVPAACEKPLPDGRPCGVQAIGRCLTCSQAMCTSHRFITADGTIFVDRCRACDVNEKAAERRREIDRLAQESAQVTAQEERRRAYERMPEMTVGGLGGVPAKR